MRDAIRAALNKMTANAVETNWAMAVRFRRSRLAGGTARDERQIDIETPEWAAFRAVCRVGGGNGWYAQIGCGPFAAGLTG